MLLLHKLILRVGLLMLVMGSLSSCLISRKPLQIQASTDVCLASKSAYYYDSLVALSRKKYDTTNCESILSKRFSLRTINISKNIGIHDMLCRYVQLENQVKSLSTTPQPNAATLQMDLLLARYEMNEQINIANADVTNILAELDCEKARILETKNYLDNWVGDRVNRLTVGSIVTGALGAVFTSVVALANPDNSNTEQQVIAISGAVVSGYLGFKAIGVKKKIKLYHARNYLQDFINPPTNSRIYSPVIWNFMSKSFTKNGKITTGTQEVRQKWNVLQLLDSEGTASTPRNTLLLGVGGDYDATLLQNRLEMLDIIVEEIDLIKYDLKRLQQEILLGYKTN